MLIRDGDRGERGRNSEGSTADTERKRPERPWTAARTMEVLKAVSPRYCPATNAIAVSTAMLGQSHKDNVRCTAVEEQPEAKEVQLSQPSSTSLLMISSGLRVQLHLPVLDLRPRQRLLFPIYLQEQQNLLVPGPGLRLLSPLIIPSGTAEYACPGSWVTFAVSCTPIGTAESACLGSRVDDDEEMLNVLGCQLTY